jgi:pimeloyl-ACP methyl ester carboxylesterase
LAPALSARYRLIMPDLRCHGASETGVREATMELHAADLEMICQSEGIQQAVFAGDSIGGYILFEFWRRHRQRVRALVLCDTRAQADTPEARAMRERSAAQVEKDGAGEYLDGMLLRLVGESTLRNRPDIAKQARAMMGEMSVAGIAACLRGMATRPDSTDALRTIDVPTLVLVGEEDRLTPVADAEFMQQRIQRSRLAKIPAAGHWAPFEQGEAVAPIMRNFLDKL